MEREKEEGGENKKTKKQKNEQKKKNYTIFLEEYLYFCPKI
jgi:hypothetical protein